MIETKETYEGWTILELMGHRKLGGYVREQELAGHGFLRIDIPAPDGTVAATQFYSPSSVYAITPTTEQMAKAMATRYQPAPVQRWELPAPKVEEQRTCSQCGDRFRPVSEDQRKCQDCETELDLLGEDRYVADH